MSSDTAAFGGMRSITDEPLFLVFEEMNSPSFETEDLPGAMEFHAAAKQDTPESAISIAHHSRQRPAYAHAGSRRHISPSCSSQSRH